MIARDPGLPERQPWALCRNRFAVSKSGGLLMSSLTQLRLLKLDAIKFEIANTEIRLSKPKS